MEQQLKQRLAGAIALVAMAVIFLPLLFDGAGYRELLNPKIEIPKRPPISYQQQDFIEELKNLKIPQAVDQPVEVPQPMQPKKSDDSVDTSLSPPRSQNKPTPPEVSANSQPRESSSRWIIQVASFISETNAKMALNKLRSIGFDKVHIEVERSKDKDIYVVKIGPEEYAQMGVVLEKVKKYYPDSFTRER